MTLNALGGLAAQTNATRSATTGKNAPVEPNGFDDALGNKGAQRKPTADERAALGRDAPSWHKDAYAKSLGMNIPAATEEEAIRLPLDAEAGPDTELERELSLEEILDLVAAPALPEREEAVAEPVAVPVDLVKSTPGALQGDEVVAEDETSTIRLANAPAMATPADRLPASAAPATPIPTADTGTGGRQPDAGRPSAENLVQRAGTPAIADDSADAELATRTRKSPDGASMAAQSRDAGGTTRSQPVIAPSGNDPFGGKVSVIGGSNTLAPSPVANAQLSQTSAGVVAALEGDPEWRQAAADPARSSQTRGSLSASGVNTLRIQLNPAELGMVTARLTAAGSQLSIEIQVESNDARQRLSSESDAILKALRAIGFDVEKVTIQQTSPNAQSQNQAQASGSGREQFQADQQAREDANARGQHGQDSSGRRESGSTGQGEAAAQRTGSDVYI